uniref:Uncharacterized protein n=1 Tax=Lutzomyia longipalpis TaxID=7200 RepID=A0A1B0CWF5_LUTLO
RRRATKYPTSCLDSLDNSSGNESNYDSQQETESNCSDDTDYAPPTQRARRTLGKRLGMAEKENAVRKGKGAEVKVSRQPTRRPDPNVFNRNALMARENRKKKKELMEQLEREVIELREKSKKLHRNLFKQSAVIKNLKQERKYLHSVIANQTEFLNSTRIPISSSIERTRMSSCEKTPRRNGFPSPDSSTPFFEGDPAKSEAAAVEEDDCGDDCFNMQLSPSSEIEEWDEMYPLGFDTIPDLPLDGELSDPGNSVSRVSINSEHNYFNHHLDDQNADIGKGGVCLHVASGKVSLEFCASCHANATTNWMQDD